MTEAKKKRKKAPWGHAFLALAFFFLTGLFIKNSGLAAEYVRSALTLCVHTVIPSVFPSAVIAGIFTALGGGEFISHLFARPMRSLFGLSGAGATVLFFGWSCGFPVGAVTGAALVRRGELSEDELSRLMIFSNLPSPAFVISAVGEGMLGERRTGIILYLILLSISFLTGIVLRFFSSSQEKYEAKAETRRGLAGAVASSVSSAAFSMLSLCASVVFFSVLAKTLLSAIGAFSSDLLSAAIGCIFEISGGCASAAALGGKYAVALCAFALGWSGFGVHFQIISAAEYMKKLPLYFFFKFIIGIIAAATAIVTI